MPNNSARQGMLGFPAYVDLVLLNSTRSGQLAQQLRAAPISIHHAELAGNQKKYVLDHGVPRAHRNFSRRHGLQPLQKVARIREFSERLPFRLTTSRGASI